MLEQQREKALHGTEDRPVNHHRAFPSTVFRRVVEIERRRLGKVKLDGRALMAAAEGITDVEVDLRTVERAVSRVHHPVVSGFGEGFRESRFRLFPGLGAPHRLLGTGREFDLDVLEAKLAVDLLHQVHEIADLGLDLIEPAVDVCVILGEGPYPGQAGENPRGLEPVAVTEFREPEGQIPVRTDVRAVDQRRPRAVHGLDAETVLVGLDEEHVVPVVVEVAAPGPDGLVQDQGRPDLLVEPAVQLLPHGIEQPVHHSHPGGEPEHLPRGLRENQEEPLIAADPPVIAPLRLLETGEMGRHLLPVGEARRVDSLHGGAARVPFQ